MISGWEHDSWGWSVVWGSTAQYCIVLQEFAGSHVILVIHLITCKVMCIYYIYNIYIYLLLPDSY